MNGALTTARCRPIWRQSGWALGVVAVACAAFAQPLSAQDNGPLKKFNDWSAYKQTVDKSLLCFAVSQPKEMQPKDSDRNAYFYVSFWPADGVKGEPSVLMGFESAKGSPPSIAIGNDKFQTFVTGDKAFVASPAEELKLIEAMKKGNVMVVTGKSADGKTTSDSYSLSGITAALDFVAKNCS
jgi:hypothetical protein